MTTTTITGTLYDAAGSPVAGGIVRARLIAASPVLVGGGAVVKTAETTTAADGTWSLALTPTSALVVPGGAYYTITATPEQWYITVPASGPATVDTVLVVPGPLPALGGVGGGGGAVDSVNGQTGIVVLTAANVGAVPTARTITAGTGLTGGGDLSANRTLAVAYGTTAGTAAQGNDARLSDARTPTAHSHAESEVTSLVADLGTLTTAVAAKAPSASPTFTGTAVLPAVTRTGRTKRTPTALTDAATIAVDASLNDDFTVTLGGNRTLGVPSNPPTGSDTQRLLFAIKQDGTGSRTLALASGAGGYAFGTDITSITLTTTASKTDYLGVQWNPATSKWDVIAFTKGY